ncbi:hypothetical protein BH20ACI2_BH20ACI2_25180 [soil metagenome]
MTKPQKRRTEITIETRKLTIIRTSVRRSDLIDCMYCGSYVSTISELLAAIVLGLEVGELAGLARDGRIHHAGDGSLCGSSLAAFCGRPVRFIED